jgi:hypothetical protein
MGLGHVSKTKKKRKKKKKSVPAPPPSLKKHIPIDICYDEDGNVFGEEGSL